MKTKGPSNLAQAIAEISYHSYEPSIKKYPFLKKYLDKASDPKKEWTLWMTAAGLAYALAVKEDYDSEHDELIEAIPNNEVLLELMKDASDFIKKMYKKNEKYYSISVGFWVLTRIKNAKPDLKELEELPYDIVKLFNLTISEYAERKLKGK